MNWYTINLNVDVVINVGIYLNLKQQNSIHFTSSFIAIQYFLLRIKIELRQEVIKTSPWQFTDFTTKNMLCEKTFKSVGGKQSEKNCGDLCPQEKSELKSATKTMLSNNYKSNTVRQHRSKEQTSTRQIINNHSLNMKQKSIQLVLITCFFTTLLMRKYRKYS